MKLKLIAILGVLLVLAGAGAAFASHGIWWVPFWKGETMGSANITPPVDFDQEEIAKLQKGEYRVGELLGKPTGTVANPGDTTVYLNIYPSYGFDSKEGGWPEVEMFITLTPLLSQVEATPVPTAIAMGGGSGSGGGTPEPQPMPVVYRSWDLIPVPADGKTYLVTMEMMVARWSGMGRLYDIRPAAAYVFIDPASQGGGGKAAPSAGVDDVGGTSKKFEHVRLIVQEVNGQPVYREDLRRTPGAP